MNYNYSRSIRSYAKQTGGAVIKLSSNDDQEFTIDQKIAEHSITLKNMVDDQPDILNSNQVIPLSNIDKKTLSNIIDFLKEIDQNKKINTLIISKYGNYEKLITSPDFVNLINAANYLDIKELLNACTLEASNAIMWYVDNKGPPDFAQFLKIAKIPEKPCQ